MRSKTIFIIAVLFSSTLFSFEYGNRYSNFQPLASIHGKGPRFYLAVDWKQMRLPWA